jgi:prepilin peptidase CpaA
MPVSFATFVVIAVLASATIMDLRRRMVATWLTIGCLGSGIAYSAAAGPDTLHASVLGLLIGGALLLPFVLLGGIGAADALLLAAVGAWHGHRFVLWTAWWMALAGAILALLAAQRRQRAFPYVPAITIGVLLVHIVTPING